MTRPSHIVLLRHAHSLANEKGILAGRNNSVGLSDRGQGQALLTVDELESLKISRIVVSPMLRARATIAPFVKRNPGIELLKDSGINEMESVLARIRTRRAECAEAYRGKISERVRGVFETYPLAEKTVQAVLETRIAQELLLGLGALRALAANGRFRIIREYGRMVVGYWPENDPEKKIP